MLQAAGDVTVPPEFYQVPALCDYFAAKRTSNFPLKLSALRQVFTIQHFSFIDVVYALLLMIVLRVVRPLIFPTSGGFLGHLMAMVFSLSPVSTKNRARAYQHLFLLQHIALFSVVDNSLILSQDEGLLLLDDIFGGKEHVYQDPGSLVLTLWDCLEKHVQQLLLRLKAA
ncbi:hypothetical protein AOLI_G00018950 [Acnodon oligacanthus]